MKKRNYTLCFNEKSSSNKIHVFFYNNFYTFTKGILQLLWILPNLTNLKRTCNMANTQQIGFSYTLIILQLLDNTIYVNIFIFCISFRFNIINISAFSEIISFCVNSNHYCWNGLLLSIKCRTVFCFVSICVRLCKDDLKQAVCVCVCTDSFAPSY